MINPPPVVPTMPRLVQDVVPDDRDDPEIILHTTTVSHFIFTLPTEIGAPRVAGLIRMLVFPRNSPGATAHASPHFPHFSVVLLFCEDLCRTGAQWRVGGLGDP